MVLLERFQKSCSAGVRACESRRLAAKSPKALGRCFNPQPGRAALHKNRKRSNLHITAVFNPPAGYLALYTNGVLAAINNALTVPFTSVNAVVNYIGRSLYSNDLYFDVSLDEFRIYSGALNTSEIAASQALGPDQLLNTNSPIVNAAASVGNLTVSWPVALAGYVVLTTTNLAEGLWTAAVVTPQISGGQWQITVPATNVAQYFRLQK